jgi:hypothetical protein
MFARNTGCASSRDSLPRRPQSTPRRRRRRRRVTGGGLPPRGGCSHPHCQEPQRRERNRRPWRALTHLPRGGPLEEWCAPRKLRVCRGGVWEYCDGGGGGGRRRSDCRTLEEEEAWFLHLEVSSHLSRHSGFEGLEPNSSCFCVCRVAPTVPPLTPAKALRSDASVPTRRRSSRASRVTGSTTAATGEPPRSAAAAAELQQVATAITTVMTVAAAALSAVPAPAPPAAIRWRWRISRTTTSCCLDGASERACPQQPPSPWRGCS